MKKRTSKEILIQTLLELSNNRPIDKITVKQIVEESGVSLKTFYNHFRDKYDLMLYVLESKTEPVLEQIKNGECTFHEMLINAVSFCQDYRTFLNNAAIHTSGLDSFEKKHQTMACQTLRLFMMSRLQSDTLCEEMEFAIHLYSYGLIEMYYDTYLRENSFLPSEAWVRFL